MLKSGPRFFGRGPSHVPREAVSNPILEQVAGGKISYRDNQPAVITPKVAFGLWAIYIFNKYLLNTHSAQEAGLGTMLVREKEKPTALDTGRLKERTNIWNGTLVGRDSFTCSWKRKMFLFSSSTALGCELFLLGELVMSLVSSWVLDLVGTG